MCRSHAEGGRRCSGRAMHNPAHRAKWNARRREMYAHNQQWNAAVTHGPSLDETLQLLGFKRGVAGVNALRSVSREDLVERLDALSDSDRTALTAALRNARFLREDGNREAGNKKRRKRK